MDAPTAAEIRARSAYIDGAFTDDEPGNAALTARIAVAAPLVGSLTGRIIAGTEGEDVPDGLVPIAIEAIAMKTAQLQAALGTVEDVEDAIDRSRIKSIAAGSWSESYWGPGEAAAGKQLDADPVLASLLWALATEDKRGEWLEIWEGKQRGYSVIEPFDYSRRPGGY